MKYETKQPEKSNRTRRHSVRFNMAVAVLLSLILVTTTSASPASAEDQAEEIAEVAHQAEKDVLHTEIENVAIEEARGGNFEAIVDGETLEIPEKSEDPIVIGIDDGLLELDLPGAIQKEGRLVDGSIVYPDVEDDLGLVVDATKDGFRVSAVVENPTASHVLDFGFKIPKGGYLKLEGDDSVSIRTHEGEIAASIAPPWAADANGDPVETWYAVDDNVLTQHVKAQTEANYPITADPQLKTSWWGYTIKLTRSEMNKVRGAMISGAGASTLGALACAGATGGLCAFPWAVGAALLVIGNGALLVCGNSKGVDIHNSWNGSVWCSGY